MGAWPSTGAERMLETDNDLVNFKQQQKQIADALRGLTNLERIRGKDLLVNPNSDFAGTRTVSTTADFVDQSGIQNASIGAEFVPPTFTFDGTYSYGLQMDAQFAVTTVAHVEAGSGSNNTAEHQYLVNNLSLDDAVIHNTSAGHTCTVEAYRAGSCSNASSFSDISSLKAILSNSITASGGCDFPTSILSTNLGSLYSGGVVTVINQTRLIVGLQANKTNPTEIEFVSSEGRLDCWFGGPPFNLQDGPLPYPPPPLLKSGWSHSFSYDDESYPSNNTFPYLSLIHI